MSCVRVKFVSHLLTDNQKENRVWNQSGTALPLQNSHGNFLENVITRDETWVCGCDIETMLQFFAEGEERVSTKQQQQQKSWMSHPKSRCCWLFVFAFFFKSQRHCLLWISITCLDGRQTAVPGLFSAFEGCRAREEPWIVGKSDVASSHASLRIRSYLAQNQTSVVSHPPYSPDSALADFLLFSRLKTTLKGRPVHTTEEIQENAIIELCTIIESAFQEALREWKKHFEWCIAIRANYSERDKMHTLFKKK